MVSEHKYILGGFTGYNGGRFILVFTIAKVNIMTFSTLIDIDDVFTPANFGGDRSRRGGVAGGQIM